MKVVLKAVPIDLKPAAQLVFDAHIYLLVNDNSKLPDGCIMQYALSFPPKLEPRIC